MEVYSWEKIIYKWRFIAGKIIYKWRFIAGKIIYKWRFIAGKIIYKWRFIAGKIIYKWRFIAGKIIYKWRFIAGKIIYKWMFIAGKIIYKWRICQQAMCVYQKVDIMRKSHSPMGCVNPKIISGSWYNMDYNDMWRFLKWSYPQSSMFGWDFSS